MELVDVNAFPIDVSITYQQPVELCHYSLDAGKISFDDSQLKCYDAPDFATHPTFNLLDGFDSFVHKELDEPPSLDPMLAALAYHERTNLGLQQLLPRVDVVTWRGILTKLLVTPYVEEGWHFKACMINKCMYLMELKSPRKFDDFHPAEQKGAYIGKKFENLSCIPISELGQRPAHEIQAMKLSSVVNELQEFSVIAKSKLGSHRIVIGAEVDCVDPTAISKHSLSRYLELKTLVPPDNRSKEIHMKRTRYIKFWAQSYLIGISKIVVGHRSRSFLLQGISSLAVNEIPKMCQALWDPKICLSFAAHLMTRLKLALSSDSDAAVYHLEYRPPDAQIRLWKDASGACFIPPDWINKERLCKQS